MASHVQFSEKSPNRFVEPENMTTIDLTKNDYLSAEIRNTVNDETIKKFKIYTIVKSLLIGAGLFILLGLCVAILILLVHRGYSKSHNTANLEETSFKILFSNKDKIGACKTTKSFEDCCYIFFKANVVDDLEKCTVQKVLNLFLQFELEINKRVKRQYYDHNSVYSDQIYSPDYYQDNEYNDNDYNMEYPVPVDTYDNNYYQHNYADNTNYQNIDQYHQNSYQEYNVQAENPEYIPNNKIYEATNSQGLSELSTPQMKAINFNHNLNALKYESRSQVPQESHKMLDKVVANRGVSGADVYSEKMGMVLNNSEVKLRPELNQNERNNEGTELKLKNAGHREIISNDGNKTELTKHDFTTLHETQAALYESIAKSSQELRQSSRINQGTDFELKQTSDLQATSQNKQANPCVYPLQATLLPPTGFDPNPIFGMVPVNQPSFQRQPLYIINPPIYSSPPMAYQNPQFNRNPIHVAGAGGQYYLCNPVSMSTNNVAGLQGVEIRRMAEAFSLQDLMEATPNVYHSFNNRSREALECPFGTHSCNDGSKCIPNRQMCDNEVNCNDASDEMECSCKSRVGQIRWCDGYLDCPNGEDEQECFDCGADEFSCDDWSRFHGGTCIPVTQRCDGIKQCEITGKDEEDCSILTDHLGQHSFYKVSNAAGFLHRNYKGKWYPTCFGVDTFSLELCKTEAGPTETIPKTHLVPSNDNYPGRFLDFFPNEGLILSDNCIGNKAAYVECPSLYCGLRLTITNPFRNAEVDTSAEDFLNRVRNVKQREPILGDSRVVGGKPSQPTSWPWVASIYKNGVFHCGGVLINELWIVTAAHCVDRFWFFYYEIQVGVLRRYSYAPMEQNRFATVAIPHEDYDKRSLKNDIALMKLSKPVRFNRYVRPICLPSESTAGDDFLRGPAPNSVCVTVGWGATVEHGTDPDHLREVEVPILPHCKHKEDKEGDEICAGLLEGGRDACQGDSGGPLMCPSVKNRGQWYLAGIVSHGEGCARPNEPGVYTKVSKYIGWINENINAKPVGRFPLQKCPGYVCVGTQRCIPKRHRCDKIIDCYFGDDEFKCWEPHDRSSHGEFVGSRRNIFNHFLDVLDLDEESEEATPYTLEDKDKSKIITKNVLSNKTLADGYFQCEKMLQTIPFDEKCNKIINCEDATDELNCLCVDYLRRVDADAICDGVTDCKDMSDEADCGKCLQSHYLCRSSQKCIPLEKRCDGKTDCINAEDEWDCVALTDGRTLVFDRDLRPKQSMKGIITINRFGVWRPLCTNASVDSAASIAANVCNLLGFEEYTVFHKLSVADKPLNVTIDGFERNHSSLAELPLCGGLFVRCLNVSLDDNMHKLHQDNVTSQAELYTSPWNAVIYLNGKFRCTGTVLGAHWIITTGKCFQMPLKSDVYMTALLGKGKAHLDVEGPHEQIVLIEAIAVVNESEAIVLLTRQKINLNRYINAARIAANSRFIKEQCIAIGLQKKKLKTVVLETTKCIPGFRCFEMMDTCKRQVEEVWNGVITCNSKEGWYTAAVYSDIKSPCDFSANKFPSINKFKISMAMGNNFEKINISECEGFRCILGQCLQKNKVCDGIPDCRGGEDEDTHLCTRLVTGCHLAKNCTHYKSCGDTEFKCKSGKCVPKMSFCDTVNDCNDYYDEPEECSCRTYLESVHPEKICDGTVNCWDRADESPESCKCQFPSNVTCGETDLCISQEMVCDGFRDCPNGEDESRCFSLKTSLSSINSGEVIQRTAGVWHSGCFTRNHTTTELEEICERLGFNGGSARQLMPPEGINDFAMKPLLDRFDVVWVRRGKGSGLKLRLRTGNEPYVKFVEDSYCYKLFIECM